MKWAQRFVYSLEGVRLKAVTQELIRRWAEDLDRKGDLELWQLHQALKTVGKNGQNFFSLFTRFPSNGLLNPSKQRGYLCWMVFFTTR